MNRIVKQPGPEHPITVTPSSRRVIVRVAGQVIADTRRALDLKEASYPLVHYIPRADTNMSALEPTAHRTYCPYKGECSYFSIPAGGPTLDNAVWSYEAPYPAVEGIKDHLAFYPDRVEIIEA
jgi:uncharacterized protein (DUF427 family)